MAIPPKSGFAEPKFSPVSEPMAQFKTVCSDLAFLASILFICKSFSEVYLLST
jgi:hypothetical protein